MTHYEDVKRAATPTTIDYLNARVEALERSEHGEGTLGTGSAAQPETHKSVQEPLVGALVRQKVLVRAAGVVLADDQPGAGRALVAPAVEPDLAASDAVAHEPVALHLELQHLPQVDVRVAAEDVLVGDIADDPVEADPRENTLRV